MNKLLAFSLSAALLLAACGDDSSTSGSEVTSISDKNISGVSQKGPFVTGSSVTVYGLDGETLAQTGNIYEGKIRSDMGEFSVKVVKLASQYALLKANGFYRNEVTGEKSNSPMTLYALTDLSGRDEVNVNLLTHLAYERSLYLATDSMSVAKAKKQAEAEVFKSFEIEGDFEAAEDLNIFGENDQSAALLAISILMQGDLKEADFSERLDNYARDIEADGIWDDKNTATAIADWASERSLSGGLATIRANVEKWGQLFSVPPFEKYVNNFWWQNYGLGICNSKREGEVQQNANPLSANNGVHFICNNGDWRVAMDLEKDTYKWKTGKDADVKFGDVVKTNCYVFEDKAWRRGSDSDCSLDLRGCTSLRQDTVGLGKDKVWYICDMKNWRTATNIEKDTATWGAGKFDGEIRAGQVNKDSYYIYETSKKAWRVASSLEKDTYDYTNNKDWANGIDGELKKGAITDAVYVFDATTWRAADDVEKTLGGCVAAIQDSVGKADDSYYICNPRKWNVATALQYDTYKQKCSEFGQIVHGNVNTGSTYFCYGEEWKRFYGNESIPYGKLVDNRDGHVYRTVKIGNQIWMAENLNYSDTVVTPSITGKNWCFDSKDSCELLGRRYTWAAAIDSVKLFDNESLVCGSGVTCVLPEKVVGICPTDWHLPTRTEWETLTEFAGDGLELDKIFLSRTGWSGDNAGSTDDYGFSVLPAGSYEAFWQDQHFGLGYYAFFWSASDIDSDHAYSMNLGISGGDPAYMYGYGKGDGFSVRCVKDEE